MTESNPSLTCHQLAFIQLGGALACGVQAQKAGLHSRFLGRDSYVTAGVSYY